MASRKGLNLDGIILLDKAIGVSSHQALHQVRRVLNANKAGHTGTLDPFASGLMVLCFGEATKFSAEMFNADKTYVARLAFGTETDTGDHTGRPVWETKVSITRADLERVMPQFIGEIQQIPPMYSALKKDGKPLYEYARAGIELERHPRTVTIHEIKLLGMDNQYADIEVSCTKGTYIRTLAQDIGRALTCGAHLQALRRTRTAGFSIDQAFTIDALQAQAPAHHCLAPIEALLPGLPSISLTDELTQRFLCGQTVPYVTDHQGTVIVLSAQGKFLGIALVRGGTYIAPQRLISLKENS